MADALALLTWEQQLERVRTCAIQARHVHRHGYVFYGDGRPGWDDDGLTHYHRRDDSRED